MTSLPFQFPVLTFNAYVGPKGKPGRGRLHYFDSVEDVSTCDSWDLKYKVRNGMLLADSAQRCWRISGVNDLGVKGSFWSRVLRFLIRQSLHRVSYTMEEIQPLMLEELKARVCSAIDTDPSYWWGDRPEEDLDDLWGWTDRRLDALKGRVASSSGVAEIIEVLFGEHLDTGPGSTGETLSTSLTTPD
jgi:hypothetical protein